MATRSQKIRLGVFVFVSLAALVVILFIIGEEKFFKEKDIYYISYEDISVSGLEAGSPVKYLGISVGTIDQIYIDPENVNRIIVAVALEPGTPIKTDVRAEIASIGITGLKMIEIRGGSNEAKLMKPGDFIQAGGSITEEITGKAEIIAEKIEVFLNNINRFSEPENLNKIIILAENANRAMLNLNQMINENRPVIFQTIVNAQTATARLDTITDLLERSANNIRKFTESDTITQILSNVREVTVKFKESDLVNLIGRLGEVIERTNKLMISMDHDMERGSKDFLMSMRKLRSTLEYLDETSRMVNEDPSILLRGTTIEDIPDDELDR